MGSVTAPRPSSLLPLSMTSHPYKISKSSRQNNRKPSTRSPSQVLKLQQYLSEQDSQSSDIQAQPLLQVNTQVWPDTATASFDPYGGETTQTGVNDLDTVQSPLTINPPQRQHHQASIDFASFQSSQNQHTPEGQDPSAPDQVGEQYQFKAPGQIEPNQDINSHDMSSLSYMVQPHYPSFEPYNAPHFDTPNYMVQSHHQGSSSHQPQSHPHQLPPATSSPSYSHNYTASSGGLTSDSILNAHRRGSNINEAAQSTTYQHDRRVSNAPSNYEAPPSRGSPGSISYGATAAESSAAIQASSRSASYPSTSFPTPNSGVAAPSVAPLSYGGSFTPSQSGYNGTNYEAGHTQPGGMYGYPSGPRYSTSYISSSGSGNPPEGLGLQQTHPAPAPAGSASSTESQAGHVRILNTRPKPQCWEHGCNGRQFSTFSNLLRHQREKSGTASKSVCPRCGAEFTRTTARNGHMENEKCKPRRASNADSLDRKYSIS